LWNHVTQPLTSDGAAVNIVIREVTRVAFDAGVSSVVAASDRRDAHFPRAQTLPVDFSKYLDQEHLLLRERFADSFRGWAGLKRRNVDRMYRPIGDALLGSDGPIIVHDGYLGAAGLETLYRIFPDRPLYLWMHNRLSPAYSPREVRRFLSLADKVICVSDWIRDSVLRAARSASFDDRVTSVLNGVDIERFRPLQEADAERVPSILFVGRMLKIKGPDLLAAALGELHAQGLDFRATFVGIANPDVAGGSRYEQKLRKQTAAFSDKVSFIPFSSHSEMPSLYREHDILVLPSRFNDPCPLVLLEGMASGLAVVAARRGGMPQVGEGSIQYFDEQAGLTGALRTLSQDAELRATWGSSARARAEKLTWERTFEGVRALVSPLTPDGAVNTRPSGEQGLTRKASS
jgi:glycosyltransferase involved in cell wall biosynthesis